MIDPVAGLLRAWVRSGTDLDAENARDALWLALRRIERGEGGGLAGARSDTLPAEGEADSRSAPSVDEEIEAESSPSLEPSPDEATGAFGPPFASEFAAGGGGGGLRRIDLPEAAALPGARLLARALRPLRREVAAPKGLVFDELATVERIAEEGLWLPVFRPATERWLEVTVVVDASLSMWFWRRAVHELERTLSYCGAFRSVATWWLDSDRGSPRLFANDRDLLANRRRRSLNEVVGSGSRRWVLLLSDCVSTAWTDGSMARQVHSWSRTVPLALVQFLPERLWERTALGEAVPIDLRAAAPATANGGLRWKPRQPWIDPRREFEGAKQRGRLFLPVTSLDPALLNRLARLIAGSNADWMPGYLFHGFEGPVVAPEAVDEAAEAPEGAPARVGVAAEERVGRFLAIASAPARRLVSMLAAAFVLTPKLVSLIRRDLLPEAGQDHEAEVLLGGLLKLRAAPGVDPRSHDEVTLEFFPGVQPLLLERGQAEETLAVLKRAARAVEHQGWSADTFEAWLGDPQAAQGVIDLAAIPEADEDEIVRPPFLAGAAAILGFVGGAHAGLVRRPPEPEAVVEDSEEETEYPEESYFDSEDPGLKSDEPLGGAHGERHRVPNELKLAQRAGELEEEGEWSEAIGLFKLLIERYYRHERPLDEAHARSRIAYSYSRQKRKEEALAEMRTALDLAEGSELESSYCLDLMHLLITGGQEEAASPWAERAAELFQQRDDQRGVLRALGELARLFQRRREFDRAHATQERRIAIAEEFGRDKDLSWVWSDMGGLLEAMGDFQGALRMEEAAFYFRQQELDDLGMMHSSARLARLCEELEMLEEARQHHERRLELAGTLGEDHDHLYALLDYGRFLGGQGDIESAISYLDEARTLAEKAEPLDRAAVLAEMAYWLEQIDRLEEAEGLLGERIALLSGAGLMAESISARGDLARFFASHDRLEEALALSRERLELAQSLSGEGDEQRLAWVAALAGHGRLLEDAGEESKAAQYYEERSKLVSPLDDLGVRTYAAADLARVCHRMGDTERALGVLEKLWPSLVEQAKAQPQVLAVVGEHLAELRFELGDAKGALEAIDATEAAYEAVRDTAGLERLRELRGGLHFS